MQPDTEFVQKQPRKGFSDRVKPTVPSAVSGPEKAQKTGVPERNPRAVCRRRLFQRRIRLAGHHQIEHPVEERRGELLDEVRGAPLALHQAEALAPEDVAALSVATRPDCLPDAVIALLQRLNTEKPVWVELGLQTIHPQSAAYIRRGYDLPVFDDAVRRLRAAGLEVIVHQILGLPGETDAQMVQTARYIGQSGVQGIKLHLLHVLRGTDLAEDYAAGKFEVLTPEHYIDLLEQCLRVLPPETVIHRLTGDGAKRDLIAPLWSADKKRVLNAIHAAFARDDLTQGSAL